MNFISITFNQKNLNFLISGILIIVFTNCKTFGKKSEPHDYFSEDHSCLTEKGQKNQVEFQKNYELYFRIRAKYNEENLKIKRADIVFAGNSIAMLFADHLVKKEISPNLNYANRGIGGDMTDLLLERLEENVLALSPKIIVIDIGGLDLFFGKCLSYVENNYVRIIEKVHQKQPGAKIIFFSVPPTQIPLLNQITPLLNTFISHLPEKYKNVYFLDVWPDMREKDFPSIRKEFTIPKDNIHFNEKGYEVWGKLLKPILLNP